MALPTVGKTPDERSSSNLRHIIETLIIEMRNINQDGMTFHLRNHIVAEWFQSTDYLLGSTIRRS
nr:hypothetical protein [Sphaerochaeta halotolerans]